jgi:hypothetical protein
MSSADRTPVLYTIDVEGESKVHWQDPLQIIVERARGPMGDPAKARCDSGYMRVYWEDVKAQRIHHHTPCGFQSNAGEGGQKALNFGCGLPLQATK